MSRLSLFIILLLLGTSSFAEDLVVQTRSSEVPTSLLKHLGSFSHNAGERMYTLHLNPGINIKKAKDHLLASQVVENVFDGDVDQVNPANLHSVNQYIKYLGATKPKDGEKTEESPTSIWEAIQYRLQDRVDQEGIFRNEYFQKALAHKQSMEAYQRGNSQPRLVNSMWEFLGPNNLQPPLDRKYMGLGPLAGRVNSIAPNMIGNIWYIATAGGGLWRMDNFGTTLTPLSDKWPLMNVSCVAVGQPQVVYAGLGDFFAYGAYSYGLMKSTDGGATWVNLGKNSFNNTVISGIVIDNVNPNLITVTTGRGANIGHGGIYQSSDGGQTWAKRSVPDRDWCGIDIGAPKDFAHREIVTYFAVGSGNAVYRSTNHGASWQACGVPGIADCVAASLSCSSFTQGLTYVLEAKQNAARVLFTKDDGVTWTNITGSISSDVYDQSQGYYDFAIRAVHSRRPDSNGIYVDGETVYVGLITILATDDDGAHWYNVGQTYSGGLKNHNDQHDIARFSSDPEGVNGLYGNDGGIYYHTIDAATLVDTVTNYNAGLGITQIYKIAVDPDYQNAILAGSQDNGGPASLGDIHYWNNMGGGDRGSCGINPRSPDHQFIFIHGPALNYTTNNWQTHSNLLGAQPFGTEPADFLMPVVEGTKNDDLLMATNYFYIYSGGLHGHASSQILANPHGGNVNYVRCIATTDTDPNRLYTGANFGEMWTSADYGAHWNEIDGGAGSLPTHNVVAINPSPTNATDVIVGLAGFGGSHLWRCSNIGAATSSRVWFSVSGVSTSGLPDVPVNAIARDPFAPDRVWYVGTDIGIFMTSNAGSSWVNQGLAANLPNVAVTDLKVQKKSQKLYAATFGRGIWRASLSDSSLVELTSLVSVPAVISGDKVPLTVNLSVGAPIGGMPVALASNNTLLPIFASLNFPSYVSSRTISLTSKPVNKRTSVLLTGTLNRTSSNATVILSPTIQSVTVPATVVGGKAYRGSVFLGDTAAIDTPVAVTAPLATKVSLVIPVGIGTVFYNQNTVSVLTNTNMTVSATVLAVTKTATITLLPPNIQSNSLNKGFVVGGSGPVIGTITLDVPAPSGLVVALSTSDTTIATVSASVTFVKGSTTATYTITTKKQTANHYVSIYARFNGKTVPASLLVTT